MMIKCSTAHETNKLYYVIEPAVSDMQKRLLDSHLIRVAEAMGFVFDVTLPSNCCKPIPVTEYHE